MFINFRKELFKKNYVSFWILTTDIIYTELERQSFLKQLKRRLINHNKSTVNLILPLGIYATCHRSDALFPLIRSLVLRPG